MHKTFQFLILSLAKLLAKIVSRPWYRESVRVSKLSGQKFATNALISLGLLAALVVSACVLR